MTDVFDTYPGMVRYVECAKHPGKFLKVSVYLALTDRLAALASALASCDSCAYELAHTTTRFPEGSEL